MTLLDRLEDAYHNGGGLNLSADDVRELMDWLEDEETGEEDEALEEVRRSRVPAELDAL
jgi:2-polyprenyl-6-methoxyphenol hydroxylase-like FAD-dependent oxidoreductase